MATKIRLQRHGRKGYAYYPIVIADSRAPRDGRFIERIGSYNPNTNPATISFDFDRALYWVSRCSTHRHSSFNPFPRVLWEDFKKKKTKIERGKATPKNHQERNNVREIKALLREVRKNREREEVAKKRRKARSQEAAAKALKEGSGRERRSRSPEVI